MLPTSSTRSTVVSGGTSSSVRRPGWLIPRDSRASWTDSTVQASAWHAAPLEVQAKISAVGDPNDQDSHRGRDPDRRRGCEESEAVLPREIPLEAAQDQPKDDDRTCNSQARADRASRHAEADSGEYNPCETERRPERPADERDDGDSRAADEDIRQWIAAHDGSSPRYTSGRCRGGVRLRRGPATS